MKSKVLLVILITLLGFIATGQNVTGLAPNQNPNYKISLDKYITASKESNQTITQGTTKQETYTAIDPMEEKRKRKELRKYFRSQRPLWRHQERIERAKNASYYNGFRHRNFGNFNNRWFNNSQSLLNLGMLGYLIFD